MTRYIDRFIPIVSRYCESIRDQFESLNTLAAYGNFSTASPDVVATNLSAELHRMAGAAHCMGFRKFGTSIAKIDKKLRKALTKNDFAISQALTEASDTLKELAPALDEITPDNSRVLQIMSEDDDSSADGVKTDDRFSELKVILADDDKHVQAVMRATLENLGITQIETTDSGLALLNRASATQPDIIITDWEMQPVSGLELLQCVRNGASPLRKDTPMIFFTNEQDHQAMQSALLNGADRFLKKPVSPEILRKSILHILDAVEPV